LVIRSHSRDRLAAAARDSGHGGAEEITPRQSRVAASFTWVLRLGKDEKSAILLVYYELKQ
jgi:hypothetical protein